MGLLGTLLGGSIGFMIGGPLGAILGGALGSNLGGGGPRVHPGARTGFGTYSVPRDEVLRNPLHAQHAFMIAVISLAAKVAKADGRVDPREVQRFDSFLKDSLGLAAEERRVAAQIFNEARDSDIPAEMFARQIRQLLGHQPQRMKDLVGILVSVAMADGHYHQDEERLIRTIAAEMGLSARDYEEAVGMFRAPQADIGTSYTILGVTRGASDAEVKAAYRKLAKEYHPDVVANKGMGQDFQKFADEKMRAINSAYDAIKAERGL